MWYGKGPGVDAVRRCLAPRQRYGSVRQVAGVLVVAGTTKGGVVVVDAASVRCGRFHDVDWMPRNKPSQTWANFLSLAA